MALTTITTDGPTITVSTAEELRAAYDLLSNQDGGGTILLEGGEYGSFSYYPYGVTFEEQPVVIKSADPANPAEFSGMYLREISNLRIEDILVEGETDTADRSTFDVTVQDAENVQIVNSTFLQDSDDTIKDEGGTTSSGVWIRDSDQVLFEGNYLEGMFDALQVQNTSNTEIIGNEITDIQGDGFRGGGLDTVTISDNYMHDFRVLNQHSTHTDMIQVWGSNSYLLTQNLTVSGNVLVASDGGTQGIFIRNEEFGKEGDSTAGYFQNVTVTDNLIYNGHLHGIRVDDADGVTIDGNTVLANPDADQQWGDTTYYWEPIIRLENNLNTEVTNNITSGLDLMSDTVASNNHIVTYGNTGEQSYVGNHFVDPLAGASVTLNDLHVLQTSPFYGTVGARFGNSPDDVSSGAVAKISATASESDIYEMTFDASGSVDDSGAPLPEGYSYYWTFADGSTAEGSQVTHAFDSGGFKPVGLEIRLGESTVADITRNIAVETKDIFAFDFDDGVVDMSDATPVYYDHGRLVESHDGTGFLIGDGNKLEIDRDTDEFDDLASFGLALDLQPTGDEPFGVFLHQYKTMEGKILEDGSLRFSLTTSEGTYGLTSREPVFDDGGMHRIGIAFDGAKGQLELFADGQSVGSTEAWGRTAEVQNRDLTLGNTWNDSMDAIIDNVEMSVDPAVVGDLPEVEAVPASDEEPMIVDEAPATDEEPAVVDETPATDEEPVVVDEAPPADEEPVADRDTVVEETLPEEDAATAETSPERGRSVAVKEGKEDGNFFKKLLNILLTLFGGRDDANTAEASTDSATDTSDDVMLSDVVPITEVLDDSVVRNDINDDDEIDLAA